MLNSNKFGSLVSVLTNEDLKKLAGSLEDLYNNMETTSDHIEQFDNNFTDKTPKELVRSIIEDIEKEIGYRMMRKLVKEAVASGHTTIPKDHWGVHETHCCADMGCKYGHEDCPVVMKLTKQVYQCEFCDKDCSFCKNKENDSNSDNNQGV